MVGAKFQKNEWQWVFLYAGFLAILISVPYLIAFSSQTSTYAFGGGLIGIDDNNTYLAKMNQGALGAWLFTLPYSSEPQNGAPIYWFYLLLGKISGTDFTNRLIVFHLARSIFGVILTLTTYQFLAEFLPLVNHRRLALMITTIGGGLGWVLIIFGDQLGSGPPPLEFYSPEAFSFLMLLTYPHLLLARSLMLFALQAFLNQRYIGPGISLIFLSLIQPVDVIIVWLIIGLFSIITFASKKHFSRSGLWEELKPILLIGLISGPPLLYFEYLFISDPILKQWSAQNVIVSPSPIHFLAAYGLYLIFAIPGLKSLKSIRPDLWRLALAWIFLIPILIYIPIGFQRRLIEGFQVLLTALAILGLSLLRPHYKKIISVLTLTLLIPSGLMLFIGTVQSASRVSEPSFHSANKISAFDWLNENSQPKQIVLSSYLTGNILPAYTSLTPFIGHSVETLFFDQKLKKVVSFYQSSTSDDERLRLIEEEQIDYVFYGPDERNLGDLDPSKLAYLLKRFEQGEYAIYQVISK